MSTDQYQAALGALSLGKQVDYPEVYDPTQLEAVPRRINREPLGIDENPPFTGEDLWTGYEFSWLNTKGKPVVRILECRVPATSVNLIESKSFKLYLNSFNQARFASEEEVLTLLHQDLSHTAQCPVSVTLLPLNTTELAVQTLPGHCIDELDVEIDTYQPSGHLLKIDEETSTDTTLVSHLLKSNCLITNQPDWGSVMIRYAGPHICEAALLRYIISFRNHNEFHEQCVERIFCDIQRYCKPEKLTVLARYTRRGGLDINPFRSNFETPSDNIRLIRQ